MATLAPEVPSLARDRAFETLYRSYVKDVYHYALALLRNPADAEDVTQTTFMNAYRAFKRGEEPLKPHNWLIKIAHNAARTRYATASRRVKEVPLEEHIAQLSLPEDERPDVEEVLKALGRLPLNQRAALVLRELEGRTYAEIADTLAVSVSAVETLIFRARRSLRLKASAVRTLGLVPVPSSLTQLLESSSEVVAGGSALFGSGFLLKALVALVAGGVVTGVVGGTQSHGGRAAAQTFSRSAEPPSARVQLPTDNAVTHRRTATAGRNHVRSTVDPVARPDGTRRPAPPVEADSVTTAGPVRQAPADTLASAPSATTPVTSAVATVTASAPALPVNPPQLPAPPAVVVPPPPSLPTLP